MSMNPMEMEGARSQLNSPANQELIRPNMF